MVAMHFRKTLKAFKSEINAFAAHKMTGQQPVAIFGSKFVVAETVLKKIAVSVAIGKMNGCITTGILPPGHSGLVGWVLPKNFECLNEMDIRWKRETTGQNGCTSG